MALYEYQCRTCDETFELRRAMGASGDDVTCPHGHADVRRRFSVFAAVGASTSRGRTDAAMPAIGGGGGCCGGACGCR